MSEQTMKILKMLEEGKITAAEANELIASIEALEEKESEPESHHHAKHSASFRMPSMGGVPVPPFPKIPDINKIVNDALQEAFSHIPFQNEGGSFFGDMGEHTPQPWAQGEDTESSTTTAQNKHIFAGAHLKNSDMTDVQIDSNTRLQGADLRYASFRDADLRGANLQGADLSYSDFSDANFNGANMQGAQLHHGGYTDTDFSNAVLPGADLSMSDFKDASFAGVVQPGLNLRGVTMSGVRYTGRPDDIESRTTDATSDLEKIDVSLDEPANGEDAVAGKQTIIDEPTSPEQPRYGEENNLGENSIF